MDSTLESIEKALDNIDFITYVKFRNPLHRKKVAKRILEELEKADFFPKERDGSR